MKSDTVYKQAFNDMLDLVSAFGTGDILPSESDLSARLGVSRTTVRKVLSQLGQRGYIAGEGRSRSVAAEIPSNAHFPETETLSAAAQVENRFMEWMLRGDTKAGTQINELEMARTFGVGTTIVREFLNRFQRFGLIEKRPNSGWLFKGFTTQFAIELFDIREMFERRSAVAFATLAPGSPVWKELDTLERQHQALLADIEVRFHDFSDLDNRFHRLINSAAPNRFIDDFYDIITLIFHYHYQWNKRDERQRNEVAIQEHLAYIKALRSRNVSGIEAACRVHLTSARSTLLRALSSP